MSRSAVSAAFGVFEGSIGDSASASARMCWMKPMMGGFCICMSIFTVTGNRATAGRTILSKNSGAWNANEIVGLAPLPKSTCAQVLSFNRSLSSLPRPRPNGPH